MSPSRSLMLKDLFGITTVDFYDPKTPALRPAETVFRDNAFRVKSLSIFPIIAIALASRKDLFFGAAIMRVTGDIQPVNRDAPQQQEIRQANTEIWKRFLESADAASDSRTAADVLGALQHIESVSGDPKITSGIEAWLSAQVVGAWTTFETLAGDLWEAALNCHPAGLSDLKGKGSSEQKTVQLSILQKHKFDLSKSMGTVLREKRSFDRLNDVRKYYEEAFFEDAKKISDIINDKSIDTLNAVRNLIVHRGSVVDQKYLDRTKSIVDVPKAAVGDSIMLDGFIVATLVQPVLQLGRELIIAVDDWLAAH